MYTIHQRAACSAIIVYRVVFCHNTTLIKQDVGKVSNLFLIHLLLLIYIFFKLSVYQCKWILSGRSLVLHKLLSLSIVYSRIMWISTVNGVHAPQAFIHLLFAIKMIMFKLLIHD